MRPEQSSLNKRSWMGLASGVLLALLASCGGETDPVGTSQCEAAIARASYRWRVDYEPGRSTSSRIQERSEFFEGNELINRNREEPNGAVSGPDNDGVWWPALPDRPSPEAIDNARERLEENDEPVLVRTVDYFLQCDEGDLSTDRRTYRQASTAFRSGETLRVSFGLGRVLKVLEQEDAEFDSSDELDSEESASDSNTTESDTPNSEAGDSAGEDSNGEEPEASLPAFPSDIAEDPSLSDSNRHETEELHQRIIHVDPVSGLNSNSGDSEAPFKTISRALAEARAGDIIRLADGDYTQANGEEFPLIVNEGIALVGDELRRGRNIRIIGGDRHLSPTWGGQNVTLVATNGSRISGITFTNENVRGTAVWLETGTATIANNTFVANHREGIFASGTASPEVRANVFANNSGNGISFTRNSSGVFEGNTVTESGYGVSISESASPTVIGNTIADNRSGVLVTGAASPTVQENTIVRNQEDGIVAIGNSTPTVQENAIAQNGQFDIHNATSAPLTIEGDDLAILSIQGGIEN